MKILLYCAGILLGLFFCINVAFWYFNGPGNRYDVNRLRREIATDLPIGSSKTEVKTWLHFNGFDVYSFDIGSSKNPQPQGLGGRKYNTRSEIVCTYDALVTFAFDKSNRLIRSDVKEFSACW